MDFIIDTSSTAERKSMSMQMISDEKHSDTIAIKQKKKYNLKSGNLSYKFR